MIRNTEGDIVRNTQEKQEEFGSRFERKQQPKGASIIFRGQFEETSISSPAVPWTVNACPFDLAGMFVLQ